MYWDTMFEETCETCDYFYQYKRKSLIEGQCQYQEVKYGTKVYVKISDSCKYHSSRSPSIVKDVKRNHEMIVLQWKINSKKKRLAMLENSDDCSEEIFKEMDGLEEEIDEMETRIESLNRQIY